MQKKIVITSKEIIYNDYRKIIETELEVYKIVHTIANTLK